MNFNWTFGRRLGAGFAIAGVALLTVAIAGYSTTRRLIDNDRWVTHTHLVRHDIAGLQAALVDAETGTRGYVITGDENFLAPYREGTTRIGTGLEGLKVLTADNAAQQRRLDVARPIIDAKLAALKADIDQRRGEGFEAARRLVASGTGKRAMDQLRALFAEMDGAEATLLARRQAIAEASAAGAQGVIAFGGALGLVLIASVGFFISRSLSRQVAVAVRHIQSSSSELQAAATQLAMGAREQATAMSEITTTISELLATSHQIADSGQRVAEIAEVTASTARTGDGTVIKGRESVAGIRQQVDVIVSHMLGLGKKSQQIGSVLDIVSELAEQTNILAINATIEAAGAGEAGLRFSVVADEIRKLADRVGGSTKEIRGLIDDIRGAVNTTVMTTEVGSKAAEAGSKQFAEVAAAFEQITAQVTTSSEAAQEIGLSTRQQASAFEQVNVAITSVAQAAKEAAVSTTQTQRTASELSRLSNDLLRLVQARVQTPTHLLAVE